MNVIDRRRNLGPEVAQPLNFASKSIVDEDSQDPSNQSVQPIADKKLFIKTALAKNTTGSSYLENDKTIISCLIFGPRPNFTRNFNDEGSLKINLKFADFISINGLKISKLNNNDQSLDITKQNIISMIQSFIHTNIKPLILLDKYPKSSIEITVKLISLNPSHSLIYLLQNILNCVNIGLIDSGLNLNGVASCGYHKSENNELLLNTLPCCSSDDDEILGIWSDLNNYDDDYKNDFSQCLQNSKELRVEINNYFMGELIK